MKILGLSIKFSANKDEVVNGVSIVFVGDNQAEIEKLASDYYKDNTSILFIDIIDLESRDYDTIITIGKEEFYAYSSWIDIILK